MIEDFIELAPKSSNPPKRALLMQLAATVIPAFRIKKKRRKLNLSDSIDSDGSSTDSGSDDDKPIVSKSMARS